MPAAKYTEAQRAEALALYETDGPTAVEQKLGIPKGTVAGWARSNGVQTVRNAKTGAATEAAQADAKALRAELALDALGVAKEAATAVREAIGVGDGRNAKDLATAYGIFLDKHLVITKADAGAASESGVNMLSALAEALGVKDA